MSASSSKTLKRKKESQSTDNDCQIDIKQHVHCQRKILGEGDSWYEESLFSSNESIEILKQLDEQIVYLPREQFQFKIFNTINLLPRDKAFYGDVYSDGSYPLYRYESKKDIIYPEVKAWPPVLKRLRDRLFEITGQKCNHCVVNQYRDNNDHIGYHFDKTRDFVNDSNVLVFSFGGERILRLKHNGSKITEDIHLKSGSLFDLGWKSNSIWKHSIIKTKRSCERRVSLTYRLIKTILHKDGTLTETDGSDIIIETTAHNNSNMIEHETKKIKVHEKSE
ncbi:unnamed protein product [Rotaria sordida]|uniref:Fe2OG dioxygenase domain-containing protein n=1 Tax=Rotaria sordida TaxID=392033 RepID=A0A814X0G9_9BILA|nr:unnamed protein product [Rotaria sordida]CAF1208579.1 unnamed protein product [Rotaria sordida]